MSLSELVTVSHATVTLFALVAGSTWTALSILQKRDRFPRARTVVSVTELSLSLDRVLLHVDLKVENLGQALLSLQSANVRVSQVLPLDEGVVDLEQRPPDESEFQWPLLDEREWTWKRGDCEIEPGELDERAFDLIVDSNVRCVRIYSYVKNEQKKGRDIGWRAVTIHVLGPPERGDGIRTRTSTASSSTNPSA